MDRPYYRPQPKVASFHIGTWRDSRAKSTLSPQSCCLSTGWHSAGGGASPAAAAHSGALSPWRGPLGGPVPNLGAKGALYGPCLQPKLDGAPEPRWARGAAAAGGSPAPPSAAWLGRSVRLYPHRISRPPLLTPRPGSLAQGPRGAGGDFPGSALSPASRPEAGPDARWQRLLSSGVIFFEPPAKPSAAAVHFCGARCSFVLDFSSPRCAPVAQGSGFGVPGLPLSRFL